MNDYEEEEEQRRQPQQQKTICDIIMERTKEFNNFVSYYIKHPLDITGVVLMIRDFVQTGGFTVSFCLCLSITITVSTMFMAIGLGIGLGIGCRQKH